jgi:SMC interacting uncharacterized protein involved in chromosome segregation
MIKKPFVAEPTQPKPWKGSPRSKLLVAEENLLRARIRGLEDEVVKANRAIRDREAELFKTIFNVNTKLQNSQDENVKLVEDMANVKSEYEAKLNALLSALVAVTARTTSPR